MSIFAWMKKRKQPQHVETTTIRPQSMSIKAGNVEIVASHPVNCWTVLVDGVPIRRIRKTVVTLELEQPCEIEVTTMPRYGETR